MEKELRLYLHRINTQRVYCDGMLKTEDGGRICDTVEATRYMLPKGEYVVASLSSHFGKGNGVYALRKPTIYVGTRVIPGVVKLSGEAYDTLHARTKKARQRGKKIVLVVE